jgi:nitrile hydratase accessory protein
VSERPAVDVDDTGPAAPPRRNGELVFDAPWEGRAFAAAVALADGDAYEWEDFRQRLIGEIGAWEREHGITDEGFAYYERWLASLEGLLVERGIVTPDEIAARVADVEHDIDHEHDHDHDH